MEPAPLKPSEAIKFARPLRPTQCEALDRFAYENEAGLFWEMGLGKTTTAIALLRAKFNMAKRIKRTLIVSPVATLFNWQNEFEINAPEKVQAATQVVYGPSAKRIKQIEDPEKSIFITNPEAMTIPKVVEALKRREMECVIVDEADGFKNPKSKRLAALLTLTDPASFRVIMTGTPILNSYLDLWAQFRILDGGRMFGRNFFTFREMYFRDANIAWKGKPNYFPKYEPRPGTANLLSDKIASKCSRLKKEDALDLPPFIQERRYVELTPAQEKAYREMEEELITEAAQGVCVATNALTRVLRMLQIISGYVQVDPGEGADSFAHAFKETPRLQLLKELLLELTPWHKVVVWAVFQENYVVLRALFKSMGIEFAELTGETKDRQAQIDRFNKDASCRIMLSNPAAGGVGVNMTADDSVSSYVIYYSRGYSLRHRLQSLARTHRGGAEKYESVVAIDLVVKGSIEEDVLSALDRKEDFAENVLERIRLRRVKAYDIGNS